MPDYANMINKNNTFSGPNSSSSAKNNAKQGVIESSKMRITRASSAKRLNNKWDAVMSKIAETKSRPLNVKEVKSRVFIDIKKNNEMMGPPGSNLKNNSKMPPGASQRLFNKKEQPFSSQSSNLSVSDSSSLDEHFNLSRKVSSNNCLKHENNSGVGANKIISNNNGGRKLNSKSLGANVVSNKKTKLTNHTANNVVVNNTQFIQNKQLNSKPIIRGTAPLSEVQSLRSELVQERERSKEELNGLRKAHESSIEALSLKSATELRAQKDEFERRLAEYGAKLKEVEDELSSERERSSALLSGALVQHEAQLQALTKEKEEEMAQMRELLGREMEKEHLALIHKYENDLRETREAYELTISQIKESHEKELFEAKKTASLSDLSRCSTPSFDMSRSLYSSAGFGNKFSSPSACIIDNNSPGDLLMKEVTSLEVVVEIRNSEIRGLRIENMRLRQKVEKYNDLRGMNKGLVLRIEDLEAQCDKQKSDRTHLLEETQVLKTALNEVEKERERLEKELESIQYKLNLKIN